MFLLFKPLLLTEKRERKSGIAVDIECFVVIEAV